MIDQFSLNNKVSVINNITCKYPNKIELFRPSVLYPEYCLNDLSNETNKVYEAIRTTLILLGLDSEHFGQKQWNPLNKYINPGDIVVLKPNMVLDTNRIVANGVECLITHPSIVAAMLDYCIIAGGKDGHYIIGDAPLHDCKFEKLIKEQGYESLIDFYKNKGYDVSLVDFRSQKIDKIDNGLRVQQVNATKGRGVLVDIGEMSSFADCSADRLQRLRVTDYDPRIMEIHHKPGKHEYMVAKEILQADVIINLPKPKTHRKAGITGAMKNMVGICSHKDYLPHHTLGCKDGGGDDFLQRNSFLEQAENFLDLRNIYIEEGKIEEAQKMQQNYIKAFNQGAKTECYFEGSWYGNDTIWRTISDLNYIVRYADKSGKLQSTPQRKMFTVADMIISGHKEGPLCPEPLPFGVLVSGEDSLLVDRSIASLMGFDYKMIPQLKGRNGIVEFTNPQIMSNDESLQDANLYKVLELSDKIFVPTFGWQKVLGHAVIEELKENFIPWNIFINDSINTVEKTVYIFGAGERGKQVLTILRKHHICVGAFVDNDTNKYNDKFFEGCSCISLNETSMNAIFVIAVTSRSDTLQVARQIKRYDKGATIVVEDDAIMMCEQ